jgi:hypothetical protein
MYYFITVQMFSQLLETVQIAGQKIQVSESQAPYKTLTFWEENFMRLLNAHLEVDYSEEV